LADFSPFLKEVNLNAWGVEMLLSISGQYAFPFGVFHIVFFWGNLEFQFEK